MLSLPSKLALFAGTALLFAAEVIAAFPKPTHAAGGLTTAIARSQADAARDGLQNVETVAVSRDAALLVYQANSGAPSDRKMRVDAVDANGPTIRTEASQFGIRKLSSGGVLWNLHGDGARFVILERSACGASCMPEQSNVLELLPTGWARPAEVPERPESVHDADGDGVPELLFTLAHIHVAACPRVSCGYTYEIGVSVDGLEGWDGAHYARDRASFRRLYEARLAAAKADAFRIQTYGDRRACPTEALSAAARVYVYSRILGEPDAIAMRSADTAMQGFTTAVCAEPTGPANSTPKPWATIRTELARTKLPSLRPVPFRR